MRIQQIAFHVTHITLHRSFRRLQYPPPRLFWRLLLVPPALPSYGFAAIQCHLSSFGPSNRPVRVFPLDQKPRWLQSAGVRGKASSTKTGMKSDDMEYTGFKISLWCKNIGINLRPFMWGSNKYSRMWKTGWDTERTPPNHTCCSHVAVVFQRQAERRSHFCVIACLCVLPAMSARCV